MSHNFLQFPGRLPIKKADPRLEFGREFRANCMILALRFVASKQSMTFFSSLLAFLACGALSLQAANLAPSVILRAPTNNASFMAAPNLTLVGQATDTDGTISK